MTQHATEPQRFRTTVGQSGKTATGIEVPPEVVDALEAGKRPAVHVTLNGHTYRTTIASRGGRYLVGINADVRAEAGVAAGDAVDVEIAFDTEPRTVTVPSDFADALDRNPDAKRFFDGLSFSQKQWFVLGIEGAKTAETRERRIGKAVDRLHDGRAQR